MKSLSGTGGRNERASRQSGSGRWKNPEVVYKAAAGREIVQTCEFGRQHEGCGSSGASAGAPALLSSCWTNTRAANLLLAKLRPQLHAPRCPALRCGVLLLLESAAVWETSPVATDSLWMRAAQITAGEVLGNHLPLKFNTIINVFTGNFNHQVIEDLLKLYLASCFFEEKKSIQNLKMWPLIYL